MPVHSFCCVAITNGQLNCSPLAFTLTFSEECFLNQARAGHRPVHAWFLKIDPVWIVCMRVCVSAPEAINN